MPDSFADEIQADEFVDERDDDFDFSEADLERDFDPYAGCYLYDDRYYDPLGDFFGGEY